MGVVSGGCFPTITCGLFSYVKKGIAFFKIVQDFPTYRSEVFDAVMRVDGESWKVLRLAFFGHRKTGNDVRWG